MRTRATLALTTLALVVGVPRAGEVSRTGLASRDSADTPAPPGLAWTLPAGGALVLRLEWARMATTTFGFARR